MIRLEVIRVRWTGPVDVLAAIREAVAGLGHRVELFCRMGLAADVSVHLRHDNPRGDPDLVELGAHLVAALSEVGLVEHSVWFEPGGYPGGGSVGSSAG